MEKGSEQLRAADVEECAGESWGRAQPSALVLGMLLTIYTERTSEFIHRSQLLAAGTEF